MTLGVSYDEFWYFTPNDLQPFIKAFGIKQKQIDTQAWIQGQYFQIAVASALSKDCKYPDKPFHEMKAVDPMEDMISKFKARAEEINATRFEKEE